MKKCCVETLTRIQNLDGLGNCLKFMLAASPYIILIPSLGSGVLNDGVVTAARQQLVEMSIANAVQKATAAGKLPSVSDAVKSVAGIVHLKILGEIIIELTLHPSGSECAFWNSLMRLYDTPSNDETPPDSGWFSGWFN